VACEPDCLPVFDCLFLPLILHFGRKVNRDLGVVVQDYNPSIWRLRQENGEFNVSPGHMGRPFLKKKKKVNGTNTI
jgi:hypothetical protein